VDSISQAFSDDEKERKGKERKGKRRSQGLRTKIGALNRRNLYFIYNNKKNKGEEEK